jgi:hypothetical protein
VQWFFVFCIFCADRFANGCLSRILGCSQKLASAMTHGKALQTVMLLNNGLNAVPVKVDFLSIT